MTRNDIIRMAREAGIRETSAKFMVNLWELGFEAGAAAEREACAKVCEQMPWVSGQPLPSNREMAAAIRARGQA